eukprot:785433-Pyramimonas_sp.AAC.1
MKKQLGGRVYRKIAGRWVYSGPPPPPPPPLLPPHPPVHLPVETPGDLVQRAKLLKQSTLGPP